MAGETGEERRPSIAWGPSRAHFFDNKSPGRTSSASHHTDAPALLKGILKPARSNEKEMFYKNMWNLVHTAEMKQDFHYDMLSCEYQEELDSVLKEEEELMKRVATKATADQLEEWKARAEAEDKIEIKTKGTKNVSFTEDCTGKRRASVSASSVPYVTRPGYINSHERRPLSYRVKKDYSASKTKYPVSSPRAFCDSNDQEIKSLAERLRDLPIDGRSPPPVTDSIASKP